jgi:hypothetical protein
MSWVKIVYKPTGLAAHSETVRYRLPEDRPSITKALNSILQEMLDKGDPMTCPEVPLTSYLLVQVDGQAMLLGSSKRSGAAKSRSRRKTPPS